MKLKKTTNNFKGVGKSSILLRFVTNEFKTYYESTLGAAFMAKMIIYKDQPIKFQVLYDYQLNFQII
jgi:hypothetical protein